MSAGRYAFKETDLTRALRAAEKVRPGGYRVRISREGVIDVLPIAHDRIESAAPDLDDELAAWRAKQ